MTPDTFVRTEDLATEEALRDLFSMGRDEEMPLCIPVCSGEWRSDEDRWRFFADPAWED
ncbi:hypothetical protein [Allomesorhizobium alhagi]|uniref:Uncharacterized protein n=1 Tax=Mesorhizobium alhagi CCNWXJ12-2 TaxID=1107882 RepID=H0HNL5_9HYPH|nr:hypothetical protein [Mesorhizobium alhagi]EHK57668.1 hypothetical protein MAXJ12_08689 [Mesorhizobium alhagi CCNWXJ12-2]